MIGDAGERLRAERSVWEIRSAPLEGAAAQALLRQGWEPFAVVMASGGALVVCRKQSRETWAPEFTWDGDR